MHTYLNRSEALAMFLNFGATVYDFDQWIDQQVSLVHSLEAVHIALMKVGK